MFLCYPTPNIIFQVSHTCTLWACWPWQSMAAVVILNSGQLQCSPKTTKSTHRNLSNYSCSISNSSSSESSTYHQIIALCTTSISILIHNLGDFLGRCVRWFLHVRASISCSSICKKQLSWVCSGSWWCFVCKLQLECSWSKFLWYFDCSEDPEHMCGQGTQAHLVLIK